MKNEIKVKRVEQIDVVIGKEITCDVCGKVIMKKNEKRIVFSIGDYWTLTTGHHDWGNDSCDSIEFFDLCSRECLTSKFDEYVKLGGSAYFKAGHNSCVEVKGD